MDDELPNDRLFGDRIMGCAKSLVGSGVKSRVSIILDEIPKDSSRISRLMHRRKASLLHLPCNMMSTTETLLMCIASAMKFITLSNVLPCCVDGSCSGMCLLLTDMFSLKSLGEKVRS